MLSVSFLKFTSKRKIRLNVILDLSDFFCVMVLGLDQDYFWQVEWNHKISSVEREQ